MFFLIEDTLKDQARVFSSTNGEGNAVRDLQDPGEVEHAFAKICTDRRPLADKLWSIGRDFVVSQLVRDVVERCSFGHGLKFVPTTILSKRGKVVAEYHLVLGIEQHDVLDHQRAVFNYFETSPRQIRSVKTWALDESRLPAPNIFQTVQGPWIADQATVDCFQEHKLTGFKFVPIEE